MIDTQVIIIGGGPAGSTCALQLKKHGIDPIILEKSEFPRLKLCAGWITPKVKDMLDLTAYPHTINRFDSIIFNAVGIRKRVKSKQYSIRRYELDDWLLKRSGAKVIKHEVKEIKKEGDSYIIDNKFRCKYIVGAGGTHCPVYRAFFKDINPRAKKTLITAMEQEFRYDYQNKDCWLWFFDDKLKGYSWYVPKGKGFINVGIGGFLHDSKKDIKHYWEYFTKKLERLGLVKDHDYNPRGYLYYVRQNISKARVDNAFIIGDSAGLATKDLAEGIGPAVESGILAADAIALKKEYNINSIQRNSLKIAPRSLLKLGKLFSR